VGVVGDWGSHAQSSQKPFVGSFETLSPEVLFSNANLQVPSVSRF
jgi:hypothetical protein